MMFLTVSCHMFMHFSCIRTILFFLFDINYVWYSSSSSSLSLSLSLSLSIRLVCSWHRRRASLLHPGTLFISGHLPLLILPSLTFVSVMRRPGRTSRRTFLNAAFIQNTKLSFRIFSILTFPLSYIVGVGSPFVASQSFFPS